MRKISNAIVLAITTVALVTSLFPAAAIAEGLEATQSASAASEVSNGETSGTTSTGDGAEQAGQSSRSQQLSGETGGNSSVGDNVSSDADSSSSADSTATENDALASDAAAITLASEAPASETTYAHEDSATSGALTVTVQWNDPVLGEPTTFHVSATGGSGSYKYYMAAPAYASTGEWSYSSVPDPSRGEYTTYSDVCESKDFTFTMTASGTYFYKFYVMDMGEKPYKTLNTRTYVAVSDDAHPSVTSIVNSAVAQAKAATDGSEYAMALYLHDWLLDQLEYDDSLTWASAEAALTRHTGTCQAYTNAYIKLLSAAGIENAETRDTYDGHTWNAVKLDGEWYQVDCTWDDNDDTKYYGFDARHLYFAITDELMAVAHKGHANIYAADGYATRSTSLADNYYVRSGLASQWADAYAARIQAQLDAKATSFSITSDNAYNPPSIIGIQNAVVAYAMGQKDWTTSDGTKVELTATSNVSTTSSTSWTAEYEFEAVYAPAAKDGWSTLENGATCYYANGDLVRGEARIGGKWYFFDRGTGRMATGFTTLPNGKRVYYGEDGAMRYGEQRIGGKWYFFDRGTGRMATGFTTLPYGKRVYYGEDGAMRYGEQRIDGETHYFDPQTGEMLY